jgi:CubicO group peptidase (beta-lactamase class C family)
MEKRGKLKIRLSNPCLRPVVVIVSLIFFVGMFNSLCATGTTWEWPRSTPEQQGLDSNRLTRLVEIIREGTEFPDLHSLLIVRNGSLVVEEYFGQYSGDKLHTLQSVSKSFTSALIGIAIERGDIMGVDEKILDFFTSMRIIKNMDKRKASMRLVDLLTMRSGTDYHEEGAESPHSTLNSLESGWDQFYLDRPMIHDPGTHFQYDSGGVILMSSMLKDRTGLHADGYAQKYLFKPLEITKVRWIKNREGHPHTGGGLHLIPRDMAKFGLLYLNNGGWEGKQVVPAHWVKESVQKHVNLIRRDPGIVGYGYLWWLLSPDPDGAGKELIYAAMGFRAQYIFVVPEHDMVVVVTGGTRSGTDQRKPIGFLYSHILPAIKR